MRTSAIAVAVLAAATVTGPANVYAQQWPEKSVRLVVPFAPGGGIDVQSRVLSAQFQKSLGQNFLVDNRTGASGIIGTQHVVDAAPDGYTMMVTSASLSVVVSLYAKRVKFNVFNDLSPVTWLSTSPLVLVVHPSVPVKSVKELVALAKRTREGMNAAGNASGTTSHLTAEMFNQAAGIKSTVLTYRGGGPSVLALITGEADYLFATPPSIMPHITSGRARPIAVTSTKPSSLMPELPTMSAIYPGFEAENWYAVFFPKGTPKPIVDKLNAAIRKALDTPELKNFFPKQMLTPVGSPPEELAALLKRDVEKYAEVIRTANIKVE
jgi:tripartite-type tricarboxylate transporter receptor subunit TctC